MAGQACSGLALFFDPLFLRDTARARRRWRRNPAARAFGASVTRATSVPSRVAATTRAERPRSTPTQPEPSLDSREVCLMAGCRSAASTFNDTHQRPARWVSLNVELSLIHI